MTTKWEFLDHPDGTEAPYLYDDQTPPSYVEKTSAGVWSLVKTGNLANREDQLVGNNWDYITDNGSTVSFYFKRWDAGGYYSGGTSGYLRATWPSNSSGDTITITNVSNGNFYLKQPSGGTSTEGVDVASGSITYSYNVLTWTIDSSSHTATNYKLYRDSTEVMSIGHTSGNVSTGTISNPSGGIWALVFNAEAFASLNVATAGSTTVSTRKKVHCNFW